MMNVEELISAIQQAAAGNKMQAVYSPHIDDWVEFDAAKWVADLLFHNPRKLRVAPEPRERWFPDGVALGGPYGGLMGETTEDNCLMRWPDCKPVLFREVL